MRLFRTLILSHALHLLLAWGLLQIPEAKFSLPRPPTVVEFLESPETPKKKKDESVWKAEKQFVRSAPPPPEELTKEKKKDPRFSSEGDQYVLEEQQARNSGLTANRSSESQKSQKSQKEEPHDQRHESSQHPANKRKTLDLTPDSLLERGATAKITEDEQQEPTETDRAADGSRPLDLPGFAGLDAGQSTVGEALPSDIQFGDFTALNTNRHLYYTFYARIEEMIRHRWVTYARAVLDPYQNGARRLTGNETWITRLEILLDPQGRFIKAILHNSSGIRELDSAPVQAFRDAQQFPHPPREMVSDDGSIHIYYQFHVQVVPRYAKRASDSDEE